MELDAIERYSAILFCLFPVLHQVNVKTIVIFYKKMSPFSHKPHIRNILFI